MRAGSRLLLHSSYLQFCITAQGRITNAWQPVENGTMAGCTIYPLAFTMAMELISRWVVGGELLTNGTCFPSIRAYMDDLKTVRTTKVCTKRLLDKLQENSRAWMAFKPSKSHSISIIKGRVTNQRFSMSGVPIPTVLEKPIKSLGCWYTAGLKDSKLV